mmetsp:Transcript_21658/g.44633  ORF Transcript_21658/g.44633 Transcript_21658/m.44633 type:complete len:139 (-) Transcript_21658:1065-1481(-)
MWRVGLASEVRQLKARRDRTPPNLTAADAEFNPIARRCSSASCLAFLDGLRCDHHVVIIRVIRWFISTASPSDSTINWDQISCRPTKAHASKATDVELCPRKNPFGTRPDFASAVAEFYAFATRKLVNAQPLARFQVR